MQQAGGDSDLHFSSISRSATCATPGGDDEEHDVLVDKLEREYEEHERWQLVERYEKVKCTPFGYDTPTITLNVPGLIVISKPAGWETDVYDVGKWGTPISRIARFYLLSSYIGARFPKDRFPVCHSVEHGFGFVHRLDQMSSGLIIAATHFTTHFLMQWQMCSYLIQRQYFVLSHGLLMPPHKVCQKVRARILEGVARARNTFGDRCRVDKRGKPAETWLTVAGHQRVASAKDSEVVCAVVISIFTGRQHQIRVHLQHLGHPSVYDGRYVQQELLLQGLRRADLVRAPVHCPEPRPLPHWHRLELSLRGSWPQN